MYLIKIVSFFCFIGPLAAECQNGWVRFNNSCYLFSHLKFDFFDAEQFCNQHGGHLVHIETKTENDFLRTYCKDLRVAKRWIGLSDQVIEGRWVWHGTDSEATFKDWVLNEPNYHGGARCAILWENQDYHWADEPCSLTYEPICESPWDIVPNINHPLRITG